MCINRSVGHNGRNRMADVKMIQTLLNLNRYQYKRAKPRLLIVDGLIGSKTIKTIKKFEVVIMELPDSDALITDHDQTLDALRNGLPKTPEVDKQKLHAFMPHALEINIDKYRLHLQKLMPK